MSLVQDVADVLEKVSVNPQHTPALYSGFLRVLINSKMDSIRNSESSQSDVDGDAGISNSQVPLYQNNASQGDMRSSSGYAQPQHNYNAESGFSLNDYQFESEMGPVADMSTFPPTMAPNPSEDTMGSLTMDNILSSGFWDSVLVPGKRSTIGPYPRCN